MRADIHTLCLALTDPLTTPREYQTAMRWWDDEVFRWKDARGLLTDDEVMLHHMLEPIMDPEGCGSVCVTFMAPRNPGGREVA